MEAIDQMPQGGTTPKRSFAQPADRETHPRAIAMRTRGRVHGPVNRLLSPNRLGSVTKPFVFLDYFDFQSLGDEMFPMHPHSGTATTTVYSVHTTPAALLRGEQEIARLGEQLRASGRAVQAFSQVNQ